MSTSFTVRIFAAINPKCGAPRPPGRPRTRTPQSRAHTRLGVLRCHTSAPVGRIIRARAEPRLSRCSGPADLTASARLPTLEPDDIAFFKGDFYSGVQGPKCLTSPIRPLF